MRGHARRADEDLGAFGFLFPDDALGAFRSAVGGTDGEDIADTEPLQNTGAGRDFFLIGF